MVLNDQPVTRKNGTKSGKEAFSKNEKRDKSKIKKYRQIKKHNSDTATNTLFSPYCDVQSSVVVNI